MAQPTDDPLVQFSDALAARVAAAAALVARIDLPHASARSGTLWRGDIVIASQQVFPKAEEAAITLAGGRRISARVAGRDPGTNVAALRLETAVDIARPPFAEPRLGGLALALAVDPAGGEASVRLGIVRSLGPAWHSLAGGRIDRRIGLAFALGRGAEGGPVFDAAGGLLGISTGGPGGRALVIPASTVERILDPLLATGHIDRGWLGLALQPVALQEAATAEGPRQRGLMVMEVAADGPAGKAGVLVGDVLVGIDGKPVSRPNDVARQFGPDSVGKQVELRLIRAGALQSTTATVTARPAG